MSLEKKIVALFLTLGVSLALGSVLILKRVAVPAFQTFETDLMRTSQNRVAQAFQQELRTLGEQNQALSRSDPTYRFVLSGGKIDIPDLLVQEEVFRHDVDILSVYDRNARRLHHAVRPELQGAMIDSDGTGVDLRASGYNLFGQTSADQAVTGLIETSSGVMQVAAFPVRQENGLAPYAGTLILGRLLTGDRLRRIGEQASAQLSVHFSTGKNMAMEGESTTNASHNQANVSPSVSDSYGHYVLSDLQGKSFARIKINPPHSFHTAEKTIVRRVGALLMVLLLLFSAVSWLIIRTSLIEPLRHLSQKVLSIRKHKRWTFNLGTTNPDEIDLLSKEFASLTEELSAGRAELELARDEAVARSSAKSDFIAKMSHEIRTPMSGVLGMTELLMRTPLSSKQVRYTNTLLDSAKSLLGVINNVLDFSKIEAGRLQLDPVDTNLNTLVEEVLEAHAPLAHSQQTELMSVLPEDRRRRVKLDALRLKQVLNNLISNALKFTRNGEVIVRLSMSESRKGKLPVIFEVSDTGIGIEPDQQTTIFESFAQAMGSTARLYGGSGLGLAICKQLIEQMGGELSVDSVPNEGSVFSFKLNLELSDTVDRPSPELSASAGCRVLIVDDNASNRDILTHQLLAWKVEAAAKSSSEEAYTALESAMTQGAPYDLIIIDLDMPGMHGLDLVRTIRTNPRFELLNIVVLSSLARQAPHDLFDDFNVAGELTKPVRQSLLYRAIQSIMKHQPLRSPHTSVPDRDSYALEGRVLVVEDNDVNAEVARSMLESMGVAVDLAENGLQGVNQAMTVEYDLILMDCQLPVVDGLEATHRIRGHEKELDRTRIPIIAATANAFKADYEQCIEAGMDGCLSKPYTFDQLFCVLSDYLARPQTYLKGDERAEEQMPVAKIESNPLQSVIDGTTLRRLSQLQQPGAPNIVRKLLSLYLQSSSVIKDRLGYALETSNEVVVRESAHALKSSSLNVGAIELAEFCKHLESISRNGSLNDALELRESLEQEYTRVVSAVEYELKGAPT